MKLGELFAGYGGLGMAVAEVFGAALAWVSEIEDAPSRILAHHWPAAPNHGDLTKINWAEVEPVDIISGGFPCQDLSLAGHRAGLKDGTRSGLWANMFDAIETIRPRYVVAENVRGLLSGSAHSNMEPCQWCLGDDDGEPDMRALGAVLADLAGIGYDAQWCGLRASDIGAPHGRYRVFILAHDRAAAAANTDHPGLQGQRDQAGTAPAQRHRHACPRPDRTAAGPDWGPYAEAIRRWEALRGTAPAFSELTSKGRHRLSARFAEWMMGLPAGHITDVPGLSWADQLKAAGNGVVPQQAAAALHHLKALADG